MNVDNLMYVKVSWGCLDARLVLDTFSGGSHHTPCSCFQAFFEFQPISSTQHYTFYDFIINKARGKSGPLFNFDVYDDVRLLADATKEKDESHTGKVVERSYYQRNKHIFPASRWEVSRVRFLCYSSDR